ncbi:uncharacterized protein LOC142987381 [Anticarsia gemmatalis]|uniref:uncharacterized protein LOC142987381 n=1 Tax=Anticarsia gemmatalis TaxID=129554 RepID=UPI003F75DAC1
MDNRAAKLALARKKLKDHQEKKTITVKDESYQSERKPSSDLTNPGYDNTQTVEELKTPHSEGMADTLYSEVPTPIIKEELVLADVKSLTEDNMKSASVPDINVTEILISNKRNLELQVYDLQAKLGQLEHNHALVINDFKMCNSKVNDLENELQTINNKYLHATQEISMKEKVINDLTCTQTSYQEQINNLSEQLEFTKSILGAKEAESDSLHSQLYNLQNQYDVIHLQLQQLTNGTPACPSNEKSLDVEKNEALLQKIANLEQQLSLLQKERDQINLHYEHYVAELNEQLKSVVKKNEELSKEVQNLSNRENSLIEQISDMEIRLQNYNVDKKRFEMDQNTSNIKVLEDNLRQVQGALNELQIHHMKLQSQYAESEAKVKELSELKETGCNHDNISITKLSADMTSDKVAAQRATEQNKKLKQDMQGLEDAFVKMSKDKLELTEKLTAEKFLNRELTIKLADVEEKAKEMQIKLKAKDEEMIRLQSNYRDIEKQCEQLKDSEKNINVVPEEIAQVIEENSENNNGLEKDEAENEHLIKQVENKHSMQKEDAMSKLQERFLKIMGEVADLSDEKHRLEHIILQLQNETDTICEYVALYQQQRSLLKRRDEERSAQLKVFQQECGKLKCELEELSGILARFADDQDLLSYFKIESRRNDMERVMTLLTNLRNNSLIDPKKKNVEFKNFYPCNCCSGQLIDV